MTFSSLSIANYFLSLQDQEAGDTITHLKLQKLIYYAEAWNLVFSNGAPLINEDFEAWVHGPALPSVYAHFSSHGWSPLQADTSEPPPPHQIQRHLDEVWKAYGPYSAKALEEFTHAEVPWKEARGDLGPLDRSKNPISKQTMKKYYTEMYETEFEEAPKEN